MPLVGTCSGCGRQWSGTTSCHCRTCHRHFSTVANFDLHEPSRRGCKDPATVSRTRRDGATVLLLKPVEINGGTTWVGRSEDVRYGEADS